MLSAKDASLLSAVAKPSSAPGATSWRISSIAVPSLPEPASSGRTSTAGNSPVACEAASESTPSDSAHSLVPTPVTCDAARAVSAACARSPSEATTAARNCSACSARSSLVAGVTPIEAVFPSRASSTRATSFQPATVRSFDAGTLARIAPLRGET